MSVFNLVIALALSASLMQAVIGGLDDVVVVLVSQSNSFHAIKAEHKAQRWRKEMKLLTEREPVIILSHSLQLEEAAWTVVPIFPHLSAHITTTSWFFFVTEETEVNFPRLGTLFDFHDPQKELFLGHALQDSQSTILHHYVEPHTLSYPSFPSGWALSSPAMAKIIKHIKRFSPSFNIDPQYEMAQFFKYLRTVGVTELVPHPPPASPDGILLTHVPQFCVSDVLKESSCATAYVQGIPNCESPLQLGDVFFAVKTCAKYHSTRLPVVQNTWAKELATAENIAYYSELKDVLYSTTDIGVQNTERGHCGKCLAIIYKFYAEHRDKHWLVIADDDTLLSVPRLLRLLRCYDSLHTILMGEVYGYFAHTPGGSSYVTGGGSMILSRKAVISLVEAGIKCRADDSPDDMFLGSIAIHLNWDIIHSPLFHQAQPDSYHPLLLKQQKEPVSFHKHSPRDPIIIYHELLVDDTDSKNEHHQMYEDKLEL